MRRIVWGYTGLANIGGRRTEIRLAERLLRPLRPRSVRTSRITRRKRHDQFAFPVCQESGVPPARGDRSRRSMPEAEGGPKASSSRQLDAFK
jgi:hypothetical protein